MTAQIDRAKLRAQLIRHEGDRLKPYTDTVGKVTIGVGRNLTDDGITTDESSYLLSGDIDRVVRGLFARYPVWFPALDPVRQAVLVNLGFNMGLGGLSSFVQMLSAVATGDYAGAADAMLISRWAHEVGARATELATQMRVGAWT